MKLITMVYENEIGMIEELNLNNLSRKGEYDLDYFNFNTNSISDFIDYLEFQDCEDYCYICAGAPNRIMKLINYLNTLTSTNIHLYNTKFEKIIGSHNLSLDMYKDIDFEKLSEGLKNRGTLQIENGTQAIISGIYPTGLRKNLIKHLYVENLNMLAELHPSLIENMAINSGIYVEKNNEDIKEIVKYIYPIFDSEKITSKIRKNEFKHLTKEKLKKDIEQVRNTGKVLNPDLITGYIDYSTVSGINNNNRLFIYTDGIYQDYSKQVKISNKINASYTEILIKLADVNKDDKVEEEKESINKMYPFFISILRLLNVKQATFITPFNTYNLPSQSFSSDFHIIGIINGDLFMVYSIKTGQFYKVNEQFIVLLEAYLKNQLSSQDLKDKFKDSYDKLLNEFMELIQYA